MSPLACLMADGGGGGLLPLVSDRWASEWIQPPTWIVSGRNGEKTISLNLQQNGSGNRCCTQPKPTTEQAIYQ